MTTTDLRNKVEDVLNTFTVALKEVEVIESKRVALENSSIVASQRDRKQNDRELGLNQLAADLDRQKTYIEEQNKNAQMVLEKIQLEKKELSDLADTKREIEKDRLQLEIDKKGLEGLALEKRTFEKEKADFEKEKELFMKEKKAHYDAQQLFAIRERNLKTKEEKLDAIERITQV